MNDVSDNLMKIVCSYAQKTPELKELPKTQNNLTVYPNLKCTEFNWHNLDMSFQIDIHP